MGILGPHGLSMHSPFCDWLNVTTPANESGGLLESCAPLLAELGASQVQEGRWEVPCLQTLPDGRCGPSPGAPSGSVRFKKLGPVIQVSSSGTALRSMRASGLFLRWLSLLSAYPHRVTRHDATVDIPVPAGPLVVALYAHVSRHGIRLGRKLTVGSHCRALVRTSLYSPAQQTGTVYMGRRGRSEITATVYDKRNQVIDEGGVDPGDLLRVEMSFTGQVGCALRDVAEPGALFWSYVSELLSPPAEAVAWVKGDPGFDLNLPPADPVVTIKRACERNPGVRTVIALSDRLEFSREHLWGYMNQAHPLARSKLFAGVV